LTGKNAFSRSLVVFQFGVSIFLIVATAFLFKQKDYMLNTSLGYNPDQVVVMPLGTLAEESRKNLSFGSILKDKLLAYEMIQGASLSSSKLAEGWMATYLDKTGEEPILVVYNYTDQDFIPTVGLQLTAGRNFSPELSSDRDDAVIINRSFARMLGMDDPTGHRLSEFFQSEFDRQIIGVVEDFHYESLHAPIYPAMMGMEGMNYEYLFVKIDGARIREAIGAMEREFTSLIPQAPFLYSFLDEEVARQYERERHWTRLVEFASILAILIACSGLVGLSLQTIGRRTREIGIRKVLGASVPNILSLINREFIWLVLAANILAWPTAYFAASAVLENYAYRITMGPSVFLGSGLLAFLVAVLTISANALKAARTNPSRTLKYE
jgi:putative ABC transport system permease protein